MKKPSGSNRRFLLVPRSIHLISVDNFQERLFAKRFSEQLQTNGQLRILREAARNADAADARQVAGNGENIAQIHLQRIVRLLADLERRRRRSRRHHRVHLLERLQKIVADERADFLRPQIICVVIAAPSTRAP